jgi:hypothetical protein
MRILFIHPDMTLPDTTLASQFYDACKDELDQHVEVSVVRAAVVATSAEVNKDDAVIVMNRSDQAYDPAVIRLLQNAVAVEAQIFPVALSAAMRIPAQVISTKQSFDITEQLRHRKLPESSIATVAIACARTIICRLQPTLSIERLRLFISHRRLDGEDIAGAFYEQLRVRAEEIFRDLIDVRVGEDAQEKIEANLSQSDAVILLDTPKAGESDWIAREIEMAMVLSLPIIWIRIGPIDNRAPLKIEPAGKPHFDFPELSASDFQVESTLADKVLEAAFRISRQAATRIFDQVRRVEALSHQQGVSVAKLDARKLLYSLQIPRRGFRYAQRPFTHLIQFFGRWPREDDENDFMQLISERGYAPDPHRGPAYDAALLLGPIPSQPLEDSTGVQCCLDSSEEYVSTMERYLLDSQAQGTRRGLVISGAFPDTEAEDQQHLTDAVLAFARATFDHLKVMIFGGHPTFTPLILDIARRRRPRDFKKAIHLYQSRFFVADEDLKQLTKRATVFAVDAVAGDRSASLTRMRCEMINDRQAAALVAIGGKAAGGRYSPGVDQEIELAVQAGLPVFLIGSAGGRTAEICAQHKTRDWADVPNNLSRVQNEELMTSLDYGVLANLVLSQIES